MHIKLLKFTLIAPYLPPYKKPRPKAGTVREILSKDAKYSTDYVITYL